MSANQRTDCFFNLTTPERIDLFRRRQALRVENVFRTYYGWVMLPLALIGFFCTGLFIVSTYKNETNEKSPHINNFINPPCLMIHFGRMY
ncbi:unnamed protein product [Caenorhabditis angaria]|uniref:Uncharacterized protein n=1 Tax=Caenorhabditis angaria TaxID=860376 RepID=A0A9P1N5Y6_9PELO|nr:unnamed protein product [Caenorhabditis angaria]